MASGINGAVGGGGSVAPAIARAQKASRAESVPVANPSPQAQTRQALARNRAAEVRPPERTETVRVGSGSTSEFTDALRQSQSARSPEPPPPPPPPSAPVPSDSPIDASNQPPTGRVDVVA